MIKRLVGVRLSSFLSTVKLKKTGGGKASLSWPKIILLSILFLCLGAMFVLMFTALAWSLGILMLPLGLDGMYYGIFMLIAFSLVFIFSIFETKSELFDCRDNELLLAMPIKPSDIVVSRILTVLIYNYVESAFILWPAVIMYAILGGSVYGVIGGVLVYLLLPLLTTSLSAGVGYIIAKIAKKLKNKTVLTTLVSFAFLVLYLISYTSFVGNFGTEVEGESIVFSEIPVISAIGSPAILNPAYAAAFVILSLGLSYLAFRIISKSYVSIVTVGTAAARTEFKGERLVKGGRIRSLVLKDLRRFFTSSTYMLNAGVGAVFAIIAGGAAILYSADIYAWVEKLPILDGALAPLLSAALVLMASMTMISASSLSLEGKSLWILKSMPLSGKEVLISKALSHVVVSAPAMLLSSLLVSVAISASPLDCVFIVLIPQAANIVFALFGIILNTAFPKFNYDNEAQVVKQSLAGTVAMLVGMVYGIIVSGLSIALAVLFSALVSEIVVLILNVALVLGLYFILVGPSARRYEKL